MKLYTIKCPNGHLSHTYISTSQEETIRLFLNERSVGWKLVSGKVLHLNPKDWEQYEAEGYSVVPIKDLEEA